MELQKRQDVQKDAQDADVVPYMAAHIKYTHGYLILAQSRAGGLS